MLDDRLRTAKSLPDLLNWHAKHQPDRVAYQFVLDSFLADYERLTYAELKERALKLASMLHGKKLDGGRLILLLPTSSDFLVAFFGAIYANCTVIPVNVPTPNRGLPRLDAILKDAWPCAIITNSKIVSSFSTSQVLNRCRAFDCLIYIDEIGEYITAGF
jgi:acyl-CoA synthetase (AMP-forming)/AMP-acid ligase II